MAESDVVEILKKDGIEHIDLGAGRTQQVTHLADVMAKNAKYKTWATRVVDVSHSGYFQIATFVCSSKGTGNRKHYHPDCDEWWVVIKGVIEFEMGSQEEKIIAHAGDIVFAKKGLTHKTTTISEEPSIRLSIGVDEMETIPVGKNE
jgi:quercetin dioxygenase-like cupin family protein